MILVTGATGKVGSALVASLRVARAEFRAFVRTPEKAQALGSEAVIGDLREPETLSAALTGVDTLFLLAPPGGFALEETAVRVAAEHPDRPRIVKLGSYNAGITQEGIEGGHTAIEERIRASGLRWTLLRPHVFMQGLLAHAPGVARDGVIASPRHGPVPRVDVRDVAAVAAHVLTAPGHDGAALRISGGEALDEDAHAAAFERALGRPVRHGALSDDEAVAAGWPEPVVAMYRWWREHPAEAQPVDTVRTLVGRAPHRLEAFVSEHRDAFGGPPDA